MRTLEYKTDLCIIGGGSRRPSGLRKTRVKGNSLAHRTTWLRSDFIAKENRDENA